MLSIRLDKLLAAVLGAAGVILVILTSWPMPVESISWTSTADPAAYTFTLEWPTLVRVGEMRQASLTITQTSPGESKSNSSGVFESRLEFNDLQIDPSGTVTQPVGSAGENVFRWSITARQGGLSSGTLWIYAFAPDDAGAHPVLTARTLELRVVGSSRSTVLTLRWLGAALAVLGIFFLVRPRPRKTISA